MLGLMVTHRGTDLTSTLATHTVLMGVVELCALSYLHLCARGQLLLTVSTLRSTTATSSGPYQRVGDVSTLLCHAAHTLRP